MKAHLKELSRQLLGSLTDHPDVLEHFSTDASMFQITPTAVVYPQNTADVCKVVKFANDRTAAGKVISLISRGYGAGQGGGALGEGIQLAFPAHMHKLIALDQDTVTVQPGMLYRTLQQTLYTHGRFLPAAPVDLDSCSVGGAVADNAAGPKSGKYGPTRDAVKSLKVVLADGSLVKAHRLSARELNRKKGLSTLEGEIYRKLDSLILDHAGLIAQHHPTLATASAGYALHRVRGKDGSFDLGQIYISAGGTLGPITEITLKTARFNPRNTLVVGYLSTPTDLDEIVAKLRGLGPSALELVDGTTLEAVRAAHPAELGDLLPDKAPKIVLLAEFDDFSQLKQKLQSTRAARLLSRHQATVRTSADPLEQVKLWKLRYATAAATRWLSAGSRQPLPFIEDAAVPPGQLGTLLDKTAKLLKKYELEAPLWGSVGQGRISLYPQLNLAKKKDVDRLFHLAREYYELVTTLGGSITTSGGDGFVRSLSLSRACGEEMLELFASVKHIFDPHNIFNPMQKTQATEEYARAHLRSEYTPTRHADHLVYP